MNSLLKTHLLSTDNVQDQLAVYNPADGSLIGHVRSFNLETVATIIEEADIARHAWAARPAKERAKILRSWFDLIMSHQQELAQIITAECGKPIAESMGEVAYGASFVEWFAEEGKRTYGDVIPSFADGKRILVIKQPVGTCAAITPWNFPVAMITRKVAPALAAGCSIILKPAELTPLSALILEDLSRQAGLPEGLFRVVPTTDPEAMGRLFCENRTIRKLSFTGSTAVGKLLMAQSASTLKRLSLELGGNAPFIVFDDADLDAAIEGLMASKFRNAGQTCVCANRILIQDGVYDAFLERIVARTAALKVGDGAAEGTQIGPLISQKAMSGVSALVDNALAEGARAITGGKPHDLGDLYYSPTVLADVTQAMEITQKEVFGPIVSVIRFTDEEEAVKIANDTPYGLAAYFYARDLGRVWRVTEKLEYGMVGADDGILSSELAPFGGIKESGIGREGSHYGIDEYLEVKYSLMSGLAD